MNATAELIKEAETSTKITSIDLGRIQYQKDAKGNYAMIREPYKFPFTDRLSYLDWVAVWKAEYKELSKLIRETKMNRNNSYRKGESDKGSGYASTAQGLRVNARDMLALRQGAKQLSVYMKDQTDFDVVFKFA